MPLVAYFPIILTKFKPIVALLHWKMFYNISRRLKMYTVLQTLKLSIQKLKLYKNIFTKLKIVDDNNNRH